MRRDMWFASQEDDEPDDPESTPEPLMEAKEIRVGVLSQDFSLLQIVLHFPLS